MIQDLYSGLMMNKVKIIKMKIKRNKIIKYQILIVINRKMIYKMNNKKNIDIISIIREVIIKMMRKNEIALII